MSNNSLSVSCIFCGSPGHLSGDFVEYSCGTTCHRDKYPDRSPICIRLAHTTHVENCRPEILNFARRMEDVLQNHDDKKGKKGWLDLSRTFLMSKLSEEFAEVIGEYAKMNDRDSIIKQREKLCAEVIDLANICMMIWYNER